MGDEIERVDEARVRPDAEFLEVAGSGGIDLILERPLGTRIVPEETDRQHDFTPLA